jgi:hypothetical protein
MKTKKGETIPQDLAFGLETVPGILRNTKAEKEKIRPFIFINP